MRPLDRALDLLSEAAKAPDRLTPARAALIAFSRDEISDVELRQRLTAAGWSDVQVDKMVDAAQRNLVRARYGRRAYS